MQDRIADYMATNNLVINADKTHLVIILPSMTEKLLGGHISQDLKWKQHILDSENSLVRQLTCRIDGLAIMSSRATFMTRLMVANEIVMSKL